jgi:hypothetical protein
MVPLSTLVPAATVIPLPATLPGCLRDLAGLWGLRGPGRICRCLRLRLLKFFCHNVQTD